MLLVIFKSAIFLHLGRFMTTKSIVNSLWQNGRIRFIHPFLLIATHMQDGHPQLWCHVILVMNAIR